MLQILSLIFLASVVGTIWGILDFNGKEEELFSSFRSGIYAFLGLMGMIVGLGIIISILS